MGICFKRDANAATLHRPPCDVNITAMTTNAANSRAGPAAAAAARRHPTRLRVRLVRAHGPQSGPPQRLDLRQGGIIVLLGLDGSDVHEPRYRVLIRSCGISGSTSATLVSAASDDSRGGHGPGRTVSMTMRPHRSRCRSRKSSRTRRQSEVSCQSAPMLTPARAESAPAPGCRGGLRR
jgi:hypothetical protein